MAGRESQKFPNLRSSAVPEGICTPSGETTGHSRWARPDAAEKTEKDLGKVSRRREVITCGLPLAGVSLALRLSLLAPRGEHQGRCLAGWAVLGGQPQVAQ